MTPADKPTGKIPISVMLKPVIDLLTDEWQSSTQLAKILGKSPAQIASLLWYAADFLSLVEFRWVRVGPRHHRQVEWRKRTVLKTFGEERLTQNSDTVILPTYANDNGTDSKTAPLS
jgi:hypothetical protein